MTPLIYTGNAVRDAVAHGGWIVGSFIGMNDPGVRIRSTGAVEVKWGSHVAGEAELDWMAYDAISLSVLVDGRFRIELRHYGEAVLAEQAVLAKQGDYVMWGPDVGHRWQAEQDSVVVTIRWPSLRRG